MNAAGRPNWKARTLLAVSCVGILALAAGVGALPDVERGNTNVPTPKKVPDKVRLAPTPIPDRIILTWRNDPSHSQAVTWRTDTSVRLAIAEYAVATENKDFVKNAKRVLAETTPFESNLGPAHYHSAEFSGLDPKTKYTYRVGDGANWSEWFQFRTASTEPEPFTFLYFGDAQNELRDHWSRVIRESIVDTPRARFIVHAGDLINSANNDNEWGDWFDAGGWINGSIPSIPTPGNHEYWGLKINLPLIGGKEAAGKPTVQQTVSKHWRPQFTLPENGPEGLEETTYYLDYQGVRIVSLNSNERQADQVEWLDEILSNNPNRWTILTFHHPIYSPAKNRDNKTLRELWRPIIDKHKVDLVLTGHDHTYGRSGLMIGDNTVSGTRVHDGGGTVYVVSVSGPKMYKLDDSKDWAHISAEQKQLFQAITIDGDRLHYQARTALGELFDVFELRKSGSGNVLVEREELEQETPKWNGLNRTQSWALAGGAGLLALLALLGWVRRK